MIREIPTINKKDRQTDKYIDIPKCDVTSFKLEETIDKSMIREHRTSIPHVAEPDVVRHYINLAIYPFCLQRTLRSSTFVEDSCL